MDWTLHSPDNYFTKKQSTEVWVKGGKTLNSMGKPSVISTASRPWELPKGGKHTFNSRSRSLCPGRYPAKPR